MDFIRSVKILETLYGNASPASLRKVADHLTPLYQDWIRAARFCVLSTIGASGTDGSPRGDLGPVVRIQDDKTLLLPDWPGNNRLDSLCSIVEDFPYIINVYGAGRRYDGAGKWPCILDGGSGSLRQLFRQ